jgi:hypothetical protein
MRILAPGKVTVKVIVVAFFLLLSCLPAYAKSHEDYPVSCDLLWAAVRDTIVSYPRDYGIQSMNNFEWRASFIVIGNLTTFTDHVELRTIDNGCAMKTNIIEIGPDNADWRRFHKRVARSLDKIQASKAAAPAKAPGPS